MPAVADLIVDQNGRIFGIDVSKAFLYPSVPIKGFNVRPVEIADAADFAKAYGTDVGDSLLTETQRLAEVSSGMALIPAGIGGIQLGLGFLQEVNEVQVNVTHKIIG